MRYKFLAPLNLEEKKTKELVEGQELYNLVD